MILPGYSGDPARFPADVVYFASIDEQSGTTCGDSLCNEGRPRWECVLQCLH